MTTRFGCRCCGFLTLEEEPTGTFEICPVCWWEDDNAQAADLDFAGGANRVSLRQENVRNFGACEARFVGNVRGALPEEIPIQTLEADGTPPLSP